jgi:hypothetical protein
MCTVLLPPGVSPIAVNRYILSYIKQGYKEPDAPRVNVYICLSPISLGCSLVPLHFNPPHADPLPNQATTASSHICKLLFKNASSVRSCRGRVTDIGAKYNIDRHNHVTSEVVVVMTCPPPPLSFFWGGGLWRCNPTRVVVSSFLRVSGSHTTTHHSR